MIRTANDIEQSFNSRVNVKITAHATLPICQFSVYRIKVSDEGELVGNREYEIGLRKVNDKLQYNEIVRSLIVSYRCVDTSVTGA